MDLSIKIADCSMCQQLQDRENVRTLLDKKVKSEHSEWLRIGAKKVEIGNIRYQFREDFTELKREMDENSDKKIVISISEEGSDTIFVCESHLEEILGNLRNWR